MENFYYHSPLGEKLITSLLKSYHSHCEYRENLLLSNMPIFVKVERIYITSLSQLSYMYIPIIVKVGRIYIIVGRNISLFSFFYMTIIQKLSHSLKLEIFWNFVTWVTGWTLLCVCRLFPSPWLNFPSWTLSWMPIVKTLLIR